MLRVLLCHGDFRQRTHVMLLWSGRTAMKLYRNMAYPSSTLLPPSNNAVRVSDILGLGPNYSAMNASNLDTVSCLLHRLAFS